MTLLLISIQGAIPGSHSAGHRGSRPLAMFHHRAPTGRNASPPGGDAPARTFAEAEGDSAADPGDSSTEEEAARYAGARPGVGTFVP
jgi:hypothetical protein